MDTSYSVHGGRTRVTEVARRSPEETVPYSQVHHYGEDADDGDYGSVEEDCDEDAGRQCR